MTSQSASLATNVPGVKTGQPSIEQQQRRWGWIFLSPWLIGFTIFTAFPMIASLYFSFTDFTVENGAHWTGLTNWAKLISDPETGVSLMVTLRFALYMLPIALLFPLMIATLLSSKILMLKPFFRLFFYMPYIVPAISGIFVWQAFLNGNTGWLDRFLRLIGISSPPNWIYNSAYINTALVMVGLWGIGNAMLTMMASMQGVPTELYEAASIDGAGAVTQWRVITLPLISPVIFYNLVLTSIGLMQYFVVPYVLSNTLRDDPSTKFINLFLYRTAFEYHDMGYACTLAWFIFVIGLAITVALFATSRRWVYYASGD